MLLTEQSRPDVDVKLLSVTDMLRLASQRLGQHDPEFDQTVDATLEMLRNRHVLSRMRADVTLDRHRAFAAMLVLAVQQGATLYLPTRSQAELFKAGASTKLVAWLDRAVAAGLLSCLAPNGKARGKLTVTELLLSRDINK